MFREQTFSRREPEDEVPEFENLKVIPRGYPEITPEQAIAGEVGFVLIGAKEFYYSRARGDFIPVLASSYCFGCKDFDAKSSMIPSKNDPSVFAHESCCTKEDGSRSYQGVEFEVFSARESVLESISRVREEGDLPQMRGWDRKFKIRRAQKPEELMLLNRSDFDELLEIYEAELLIIQSDKFSQDRKLMAERVIGLIGEQIENFEIDSPHACAALLRFNNPDVLIKYISRLLKLYSGSRKEDRADIINSLTEVLNHTGLFDDAGVIREMIQNGLPMAELMRKVGVPGADTESNRESIGKLIARLQVVIKEMEKESLKSPMNPETLIPLLELIEKDFVSESESNLPNESLKILRSIQWKNRLKITSCVIAIPPPLLVWACHLYYSFINLSEINHSIFLALFFNPVSNTIVFALTGLMSLYFYCYRRVVLENSKKIDSDILFYERIFEPLKSCISDIRNIRLSEENPVAVAEFKQAVDRIHAKIVAGGSEELPSEDDPEDFIKEKKKILDSRSLED